MPGLYEDRASGRVYGAQRVEAANCSQVHDLGGGWSDRTDPSAAGPGSTAKLGGKCARNTLGFTNKQGQIDMI